MKYTERSIARLMAMQFFAAKYLCITPNCTFTGNEADLLVVTKDLRLIDVEIKISRADFRADAKKDKWGRHKKGMYFEEAIFGENGKIIGGRIHYHKFKLDWPRRIWKHYYVMPEDIYTPDLLDDAASEKSGILVLSKDTNGSGSHFISPVRAARANRDAEKITHEEVVNIARLASLRMWNTIRLAEQQENR